MSLDYCNPNSTDITHFLCGVRSIKSNNRTATKKSWDFKRGKVDIYNAINDKAVYC